MNDAPAANPGPVRLRLPATSANLGAGFDAAAIALDFYLDIEAEPAADFSITATGRDWQRCARLENNLILDAYSALLEANGRPVVPLAIHMNNAIPLGMGCGSSAAGRLAAVALAVHFGRLAWESGRIIDEACRLEGHPDNVAACWLGGLVMAAYEDDHVRAAQVDPPASWRAVVVLPAEPLSTTQARAVLPATYPRADVVANLQSAALLGLAFAQARGDLLRVAMNDRIHQPYRAPFCPLLPLLSPLIGQQGILGLALSGAGPAVLVVVEDPAHLDHAAAAIHRIAENNYDVELLVSRFPAARESQPINTRQAPGVLQVSSRSLGS